MSKMKFKKIKNSQRSYNHIAYNPMVFKLIIK